MSPESLTIGDTPQTPAAAAIELSRKFLRRIVTLSLWLACLLKWSIWIIWANPDISLQRRESRRVAENKRSGAR